MKIIGKTSSGFIIEAGENEVARLIGFYSSGRASETLLKIGADIQVNPMFDQLYKIKELKRNITEIEANAVKLLESIRTKNPLIMPIVEAVEKGMSKKD